MSRKKAQSTPKKTKRAPYSPPKVEQPKVEQPKVEQTWTEFLWHGRKRFRCTKCMFDTDNERDVYLHFKNTHDAPPAPEPKVQKIDTGLVSPEGDKIVRVEEVPDGEN